MIRALLLALLLINIAWPVQSAMAQTMPLNQREQSLVRGVQYQSNQYLAAFKRQADAKLRAQDADIRKLTDQLSDRNTRLNGAKATNAVQRKEVEVLRAEKAQLEKQRDALIAAQLDQIAARDAQFAQDRADIQATVATLLTSPKGAEALEAFNAGDDAAARQIWAAVHQGFSAARQKRAEAEDGAYWRSVAQTRATRLGQGQVTVSNLIEDWEKIPDGAREQWDWIEMTRLYQLAALREQARSSANAALGKSTDDRARSAAFTELGVLLESEDRAAALVYYKDALAISERLAKTDPSNAQAQRDLSISYERLGDLLANKDRAAAMVYYKDALAISERLAKADPGNMQAQRDLSRSYNKLGDLLANEDRAAALVYYKDALAIRERLAKADPGNAQPQRDLSISYGRLGDLLANKDRAAAMVYYEDALAISDRLAKADPGNVLAQRDLAISYIKLGDLLANEDRAAALVYYKDALAISEQLAKADPGNAQAQRDLLVSLWRMANLAAPDHNWARVKAQLDAMRKANQLMPEDANLARDIDRRAAEEAAKAK